MRYLEAISDVMNYAIIALSAIDYVEPNVNANKCIVYPELFEEMKALVDAMFFIFCTCVFYINKQLVRFNVLCLTLSLIKETVNRAARPESAFSHA
jgi:hypothetical protein